MKISTQSGESRKIKQCRQDMVDLGIPKSLVYFEGKSKDAIKREVKKKSVEYAFKTFESTKSLH